MFTIVGQCCLCAKLTIIYSVDARYSIRLDNTVEFITPNWLLFSIIYGNCLFYFAMWFLCCMNLDSGLWFGPECTEWNDRLRGYKVVPCTWDYAQLDALQSHRYADPSTVPINSWIDYMVSYKLYIVLYCIVLLLSWSWPVRCYLNSFNTSHVFTCTGKWFLPGQRYKYVSKWVYLFIRAVKATVIRCRGPQQDRWVTLQQLVELWEGELESHRWTGWLLQWSSSCEWSVFQTCVSSC